MTGVFSEGSPPVVRSPPARVDCDIAIIGAGMGGATLAFGLRESGVRVLVIEQGDFLPREYANWSPVEVHQRGRYKNSATWHDDRGRGFVPGNYHYVGGSTKLYGAALLRFREADFGEIDHPDGPSPAWPFGYAELEPYYAAAERIYLVHGQAGEDPTEPWRSGGYPFPPIPHEPSVAALSDRLAGMGLHPFALPLGIDLQASGRCVRCKTCDAFPCLVDAKGDADVCAMRPALKSPTVRLLTRATVLRLNTGRTGRRVEEAVVQHEGGTLTVHARRFVVAAGAINTAALLLRSRDSQYKDGLANSSAAVGRHYMTHTTSFLVGLDPFHRNEVVFQKTIGLNDWYLAGPSNTYPLGNVQGLGKLQGPMVKSARRLIPTAVLETATGHTLDLFVQTEDIPLAENRISIDSSDRIRVFRRPTNVSSHRELVRRMTRALRRSGYPMVFHQSLGIEATAHQCGTARMGMSGTDSVVRPDLRTHDIDNLWLVDSSVFPSSSAVNPALTVAALALRAATGLTADK